jgi:hypothetical protein
MINELTSEAEISKRGESIDYTLQPTVLDLRDNIWGPFSSINLLLFTPMRTDKVSHSDTDSNLFSFSFSMTSDAVFIQRKVYNWADFMVEMGGMIVIDYLLILLGYKLVEAACKCFKRRQDIDPKPLIAVAPDSVVELKKVPETAQ